MLLGLSAIVLIWIGTFYFTHSEWVQTDRAARQTEENLAKAFEEQIIRTIRAADQTLIYVRDTYAKDPQHFASSPWAGDPQFISDVSIQVAIIDKDGRLAFSNIARRRAGPRPQRP